MLPIIKKKQMFGFIFFLLFLIPVSCFSGSIFDLSIEELSEIRVESASKYEQMTFEAPSSITIITKHDIKKYGWKTLADLLKGVRGFYITYDRCYSYIGFRGFLRPGDYNTKILLLVNGHRINDNVYDQAYVGTEFPVDLEIVERVEIIRGPASSLYGSNAFFGIINVITKSGRDTGPEISLGFGSYGEKKARLSFGTQRDEMDILVSTSLYNYEGRDLQFREFDGTTKNADRDSFGSFYGSLGSKNLRLEVAYISRKKIIPTAPWETTFGQDDTWMRDERGYIFLRGQKEIGHNTTLKASLSLDFYRFSGNYVYEEVINRDEANGNWYTLETEMIKNYTRHNFVLGSLFTANERIAQKNYDKDPYYLHLFDKRRSFVYALFAQDEFSITDRTKLYLGLRYDHSTKSHGILSPRLSFIYRPKENDAIKLIYGEAFRDPNAYELYYNDNYVTQKPALSLRPERIRTFELIYEKFLNDLNFTAVGFYSKGKRLIELQKDDDGFYICKNIGEFKVKGFELELKKRWKEREFSFSYMYQDGLEKNSPSHLLKVFFSTSFLKNYVFGYELLYRGKMETIKDKKIGGSAISNINVYLPDLVKNLDISFQLHNLFDRKYGDPPSSEHRQEKIVQDGRTYFVKLLYNF